MDDLANSSNQLLLSGLPPELLRIILSFSSDFQSLLSAIASCRALYHAFHSFPGPLVTSVLNREFDPTLLPEIIRIIDARKLRQSSLAEPQLSDAIQRLIHREGETAHEWTLSEGIAAVQLDAVVRDLANAVAEEFLKTIQRYIHRGHEGAPSSAELRRIRLALYRFEAYRVMFPPVVQTVWPPFEVRANWATFFQVYTPWEIEQLGSVHESLFCLIGTVFNNAVLHDIDWGCREIEYAYASEDGRVEWLLSRGLRTIRKLLHTNQFEDRQKILDELGVIHQSSTFLYEAFEAYKQLFSMKYRESATDGLKNLTLSTRYDSKSDSAMERIWEWFHAEYLDDEPFPSDIAMDDSYRPLRACGYMFWDVERLIRSGWLRQALGEEGRDIGDEIYTTMPSRKTMTRSWIIRQELFSEGQRGYWGGDPDNTEIDASREWRLDACDTSIIFD